jgi:hypothetical protein
LMVLGERVVQRAPWGRRVLLVQQGLREMRVIQEQLELAQRAQRGPREQLAHRDSTD